MQQGGISLFAFRPGEGALSRKWRRTLITIALVPFLFPPRGVAGRETPMIDIQKTVGRLRDHLRELTVSIGERSVFMPANLERTAQYIESFHRGLGLPVGRETYQYAGLSVAIIVAEISYSANPTKRYVLGAHFDSVAGTVGADDNASAVAVQLETARNLLALKGDEPMDLAVKFVSFPLEEPPVFGTRYMGSKVYARKAKREKEQIDGMICLEMVGYSCHDPGCQGYPFPLMFFNYPKEGNFIGIVGDFGSREFTSSVFRAFQSNSELPAVKLTVPFRGWPLLAVRLSDHSSFWDQGFKAVMITDTSFYRNPHYHLPSDTMEKLDYRFMAELVKSLMAFFRSHHR
jgi:Zn-dependent M28 family amino/carboxypeptidase